MKHLLSILCLFVLSCDSDAPKVYGCTAPTACNFNSDATIFDDSCEYAEENYDCEGNCIIEVDCNGECFGDAVVDECGVCGENQPGCSLIGNWYTNGSISGDGDSLIPMTCSTITFLDNTFESSEGASGTFTINENEMDILILEFPDVPEYEGEVSLCIFDIENNILSVLCNEPGNPDYHPPELLPLGAIFRNMEVTGISDCSEDLDVDGIIDTEDDCIHFDFDDEVDCLDEFGNQISCDYTCVDESDQTPNLLQITLPEASELIIILTYECSNIYNETIVDGYYTAGSYNIDINSEDLNTGFYNINVSVSDFNESQSIWICNP